MSYNNIKLQLIFIIVAILVIFLFILPMLKNNCLYNNENFKEVKHKRTHKHKHKQKNKPLTPKHIKSIGSSTDHDTLNFI